MTGVPARTFWLSHFLFDLCLYSLYTIAVLSIYYVWDRVINDHKIYFANFEHSSKCNTPGAAGAVKLCFAGGVNSHN
jgi:hypothetical protein